MTERDPNFFYPGEDLPENEMRITALGTGMPFVGGNRIRRVG